MKTAVAKPPAVRTTFTDVDSSILLPNVNKKDFKRKHTHGERWKKHS